jgi:transcriptional regulator with XRE-family HTH domain
MEIEATTEDRERLRDRVKGLLEQAGKSQKQVETDLGWGSGTLSRVFGGKKAVNVDLLTALAGAVGTAPDALVEGTSWASLFGGAGVPPANPADAAPPVDAEAPTVKAPLPVAAEAPPAPAPPAPAAPVSDASSTTVRTVPAPPASAISAPPTPMAAMAAVAAATPPRPIPPVAAPAPVAASPVTAIPAPSESSRAKLSNPPAAPPPGPPAATPPPAPTAGEAESPGMMGRIRQFFSRMWSR